MSLHPFIALSALRNGLIGNMMKEMNMSTNESAQSVESNQKTDIEIDREAFEDFAKQRTIDLEETNGGLHRPVFTTVEQAVDSLTHVLAKLLQTVMLMEKHLADISKAIDRVAR